MINVFFATLLRDSREPLNARFQAARHRYPDLEATRFRHFLELAVDPLIAAVANHSPDSAGACLFAVYDIALDLCGQRLVGADSRCPAMNAAWAELLPAAVPLLVRDPAAVLTAVCNATHQLATTPGARPAEWLASMKRAVPACADASTWLRFGQVQAWRSGLSHYRDSALRLADSLPPSLVLPMIGGEASQWTELRDILVNDPWWEPGVRQPLKEACRVGGYSGFGGPFHSLPSVASAGEQLFITSGSDCWLLIADSYGSTLHRATESERISLQTANVPALHIRGNQVGWKDFALTLADLGSISGHAMNRHTLLLCSPDTYQVVVVALYGARE